MKLKVIVNGVEIVRNLSWSEIVNIKDELKKLGFKWNGEAWIGKTYSISTLVKLKEILNLSNDEVKKILDNYLVNAEGGVIGIEVLNKSLIPDELKECIIEELDNVYIISISCYLRNFVKKDTKLLHEVSNFEEYLDKGVECFKELIKNFTVYGDLLTAIENAKLYVLNSSKLRKFFEKRLNWWSVFLKDNYVELNFVRRGLLRDLMQLKIPYYKVDAEGNVHAYEIKLIRRDDVVKLNGKWRIYFPLFIKDKVVEVLRNYGYIVKEIEHEFKKVEIPKDDVKLYDFQIDALNQWFKAGNRGTIVIPTGGGKTFIALKALAKLKVSTIILVTTEELMDQWYNRILRYLGYRPGRLSGKYDELKDVTIITYNTAVKRIDEIRNKFDFVIADECHHVPAETFKEVLFKISSPYRMALSATPTRTDGNEHLIFLACGEIVYKITYRDLIKYGLVVPIRHFKIYVELNENERSEYERAKNILQMKSIAGKAKMKIDIVKKIVEFEYKLGSKILVFTQYIQQAEDIYREIKNSIKEVSILTSETKDRDTVFKLFEKGLIKILVTTTVLDEGIDVPDADVAIIVSGTGSPRQMIQRIGRVCRATEGKKEARVYEIITRNTIEEALSKNRHPSGEIFEIECRDIYWKNLDRYLTKILSSLKNF